MDATPRVPPHPLVRIPALGLPLASQRHVTSIVDEGLARTEPSRSGQASANGLFVPNPSTGRGYQRRSTPGLRQTVRGRPLASTAIGSDCHSLRHSVARCCERLLKRSSWASPWRVFHSSGLRRLSVSDCLSPPLLPRSGTRRAQGAGIVDQTTPGAGGAEAHSWVLRRRLPDRSRVGGATDSHVEVRDGW